jgi:hypothetical protein
MRLRFTRLASSSWFHRPSNSPPQCGEEHQADHWCVSMTTVNLPEAHEPEATPSSAVPSGYQGVRRVPAVWVVRIGLSVAAIALFFAYLGQARTMPTMSDGASQALQAWAMLHGNLLLRGWSLSDVSFYTTELPEYAFIELVRGLNPGVVHIAAALTYTMLVLLAGWLAKGMATGREAMIRFLIATGIMLAPALGSLNTTFVVLAYPDHTGTQVPLLATWLLLDRVPPRWSARGRRSQLRTGRECARP